MLRESGLKTANSNSSESYNCVLKRLQEWKERPIDVVARAFMLLSQYHSVEILRGRYGLGDLTLAPHLKDQKVLSPGSVVFVWVLTVVHSLFQLYDLVRDKPVFNKTARPEQIVQEMQELYAKMKEEVGYAGFLLLHNSHML